MPSRKLLNPISENILLLCKELQTLPVLDGFYLGGGTALAMYFQHRESNDIDLISSKACSRKEISSIIDKIKQYFGSKLRGNIYLNDLDEDGILLSDNLLFIRFYVQSNKSSKPIKVELLQNVYCNNLSPIVKNDIKVLPLDLIAILKMAAANDRAAKKDIYDMYFLTRDSKDSLGKICNDFDKYKQYILTNKERISVFDTDINETPILEDPSPLLTFEFRKTKMLQSQKLPMHSNHEVIPAQGNCSFQTAASQYRMTIRSLYADLGKDYPNIGVADQRREAQ